MDDNQLRDELIKFIKANSATHTDTELSSYSITHLIIIKAEVESAMNDDKKEEK